jgi:ferredoxin-NADP reductase
VFGLVLLYRFIRPLWLFNRHRFAVARVVAETPDVISIYITGRNMESFQFQAGQFANWTFLGKGLWWTHPFSFSQSYNGKELRITVKSLGDFTARLQNIKPGTPVIVDGPLGRFTLAAAQHKKYLFIAGGIGITPINALLQELQKQGESVLLYGNKTTEDIVFGTELQELTGHMTHFLSGVTDNLTMPNMKTGYITKDEVLQLVPDIAERDIYVCGPPVMMKNLTTAFRQLGLPKNQIHFEQFSY